MAYLDFEIKGSPGEIQGFHELLGRHSQLVRHSAEYLQLAIQLLMARQTKSSPQFHSVVFLLARHLAEEIDAISVLVAAGCITPCKLHLRSAFEADLGALYILEDDSERRALAYLAGHAKSRIRWYDKSNPNSPAGKQLRKEIANDELGMELFSTWPEFDFGRAIAPLEGMLHNTEYKPLDDEWRRAKSASGRNPPWHGLFNGPKTIRELAIYLKRGFWYEYLYTDWSNHVHASNGVTNLAKLSDDPSGEMTALKPLRHPNGLGEVVDYASNMALGLGTELAQRFLSQMAKDELQHHYVQKVRPLREELQGIKIKADWK